MTKSKPAKKSKLGGKKLEKKATLNSYTRNLLPGG